MKVILFGSKNRVLTFANQLVNRDVEVHVISNRAMNKRSFSRVDPKIIFHESLVNRLKKDDKNPYANIFLPFTLIKLRKLISKIN